ncbi:MAG TPA: hypothetical protein VGN72_02860 [Tepidisphaeraceae bacterium]|jgi:hypothetical protein|nr:hypothetical protein [Tepidisphaeraceae bacterium]
MDVATALLIILSHAGYWVGGQVQTVEFRWGLNAPMPTALVRWDLSAAGTTLVEGEAILPAGKAKVTLRVPTVRQPIAAKFRFRASMVDGGRELLAGEQAVQLHPNNLGDLAALTADRPLLVVDAPDKLPAILTAYNATFDQFESIGKLVAAKQQTIVVGQDRLSADDRAASVLTALADRGASIGILRRPPSASSSPFSGTLAGPYTERELKTDAVMQMFYSQFHGLVLMDRKDASLVEVNLEASPQAR